MATATLIPTPDLRPQRLFTVAEYHKMIEVGLLTPNDRCELIHGVIVEKLRINPPHATAVRRLMRCLMALLGLDAVLRIQLPLTLSDSEPEPDVVFAAGSDDDYTDAHPGARDALLVVEVADTTLEYDQTTKLRLYAAEKVIQYWIVNIPNRRIEVYTDPRGGRKPIYRSHVDYTAGQAVPIVVAGQTLGTVPVSELLP